MNIHGRLLRQLGYLLLFLCCLLAGLYVFEQLAPPAPEMPEIGTQRGAAVYQYDTRDHHVSAMQTRETNAGSIAYLDLGERDAPVMLLLHGTPTNSWLWRKTIPGFLDQGYRVIAPDMLGFGMSEKPVNIDLLTPELQAQRIVSLLDDLGVANWSIVAHDQGGLWLRELLATVPQQIETVTILNTIAVYEGFHPPIGYGSPNILTRGLSFFMGSRSLGRLMAYAALNNGLHTQPTNPEMIRGYVLPLQAGTDRTYYQFISSFGDMQIRLSEMQEQWSTLNIPVQIIRGAHDKILVADEQIPLLQQVFDIPESDIHILDNATHFLPEEVPEELVDLIADFARDN